MTRFEHHGKMVLHYLNVEEKCMYYKKGFGFDFTEIEPITLWLTASVLVTKLPWLLLHQQ